MKKAVFALILSAALLTGCSLQEDESLNSDPVTFEYSGITTPPETTETTAEETEPIENNEIFVEFRKGTDADSEPVLTDKDITSAKFHEINMRDFVDYGVFIQFSEEGTKKFADITTELSISDTPLSIWINGQMVCAPRIGGYPITNGQTIITGNFTKESAEKLAEYLNNKNIVNNE